MRNHDPDESVQEDEGEDKIEEMDEDENEEDEEDDEEDDEETDDDDDEEGYNDDSDVDDQKIQPWDVLMNTTSENMRDNETVEKTLEESPGTDVQKAEEIAYDELKPKYLSDLISRYKYMSEFSAALKKDPVNKKIASTAKRLRDDYDEDESRKYAIKKRKFLI